MVSPVTSESLQLDVSKEFLEHARAVRGFAPESILKYRDCLHQIEKATGTAHWQAFSREDLFALRVYMTNKALSPSRQTNILYALKRLLEFLRDERGAQIAIDPSLIRPVASPRKRVVYLTPEEVARVVAAIRLHTYRGKPSLAGYRLRALVEVLLGTGMRIGEALSLNRQQIDYKTRTAAIVGKGSKERIVFFTQRALDWMNNYLALRTDHTPQIFVTLCGSRPWSRSDIWCYFARLRAVSGIAKPIRPHLLRHTAATQLLFQGCPIGHIKEILGHDRLETTCRYYLGLDHRAAQQAHARYLHY